MYVCALVPLCVYILVWVPVQLSNYFYDLCSLGTVLCSLNQELIINSSDVFIRGGGVRKGKKIL